MGFFSFIRKVASDVVDGVKAVYNKAKEVAGKAIEWVAEKAENVVHTVKKVWSIVKPYVEKARVVLKTGATIALKAGYPWIGGALLVLDKGIGALTAFENSPIAKLVYEAIKWAIKLAKLWQNLNKKEEELDLSEAELDEARKHQKNLRFAEREVVSPEERHQFELAGIFNDYAIAKADLDKVIESAPENFEHYLRLRATQKLLKMSNGKFISAKTVDDLSADDIFLVRIASDLIKPNPELSKEAAQRLDRVLTEKHGKKLMPFVYEEMVVSWAKEVQRLDEEWSKANEAYAKNVTLFRYLSNAKEIQMELSPEEEVQFKGLEINLPKEKEEMDNLATEQRDLDRYVGASEGLLQILEKTPEQIEAEDRTYLLDQGMYVGELIIKSVENNTPYAKLSEEDQSLLTDYANIFHAESKARMEKLLPEVTA